MNIELFNSVTTESALLELESTANEYQGLYVDMEDAKQRKYVKEKASTIAGLTKLVDRARIDLSKDYKSKVEAEAGRIIARLQKANEPFTLLIDDYNAERKRVLDAERERKQAAELAIQKELDHEFALLLDKSHAADKAKAERIEAERIEEIKALAVAEAMNESTAKAGRDAQRLVDESNARLANNEHVRAINRKILVSLMQLDIAEDDAKRVISMVAKGQIQHLTINY